jgi:AraC-like DNA-binding protein
MLLDLSLYTPTYVSLTWAFILLFSSKTNRARFFLGLFMFVIAMVFLSHLVYYNHLKNIYLYFDLIFIFGSLCIFPIYYWYVKLLTFRSKIDLKDLKHLIPAVTLVVATAVTYLFMSKGLRKLYVNNYLYGHGTFGSAPILIKVQLILCYALQTIYFLQIVFSFLKIRVFVATYNENIANFYSNLENKTLQWPKIILNSFVVTSVFTIFTNFLGRSFFNEWPMILLVTGITYSIFFFILGYLGYMQNHTIVAFEQDNAEIPEVIENPNNTKIKIQLQRLFEKEQVYKNPDLKISDIAARLNTNRTYISTLINQEFACSFSTFVNKHRVEEAKKMLLSEECNNYCLEHISSHAGFGSLHSFIRVFKEIEGSTPGYYRENATKPQLTK